MWKLVFKFSLGAHPHTGQSKCLKCLGKVLTVLCLWLGHKPCTDSLDKTHPLHSCTSINLQIFTGAVSFPYQGSSSALEQGWLPPATSKPFTQTIKLMYCEKQGLKSLLWDTEMTLKGCHCHSWCDPELKVYSKISQTKQSFWREIKCELVFGSCAVHLPGMG